MKARKGKGAKTRAPKSTLARRTAMVVALRREAVRIAESVMFGYKLGGGIEVVFGSFAEFRAQEGRAVDKPVVDLPPPWFTEWA